MPIFQRKLINFQLKMNKKPFLKGKKCLNMVNNSNLN